MRARSAGRGHGLQRRARAIETRSDRVRRHVIGLAGGLEFPGVQIAKSTLGRERRTSPSRGVFLAAFSSGSLTGRDVGL